MNSDEKTPLVEEVRDSVTEQFSVSLGILWRSESSLFRIFILNFLMSFQFHFLVLLVPIYFTDEHDLSDLLSGTIFGIFGILIGVLSILISCYSNKISLRTILVVSSMLGLVGFILMGFANMYLSLFSIIVFQSLSCAISWPFTEFGIKVYADPDARDMACSIYYMCNYVSGVVAGVFVDIVWTLFEDDTALYQILYFTQAASCLVSVVVALGLRDVIPERFISGRTNVLKSKTFWRYVGLISLMVVMESACFGHLDSTFPKYLMRITDDDAAHFGLMFAAHTAIIMISIFIFAGLDFYYESYGLIVIGSAIGAVSTISLVFWENYVSFSIMIFGVSVGEALWVVRLLEYTFQVAPEGHESIYLALCNCPFYFGMIITGVTSGILLDEYCPEDGSSSAV